MNILRLPRKSLPAPCRSLSKGNRCFAAVSARSALVSPAHPFPPSLFRLLFFAFSFSPSTFRLPAPLISKFNSYPRFEHFKSIAKTDRKAQSVLPDPSFFDIMIS